MRSYAAKGSVSDADYPLMERRILFFVVFVNAKYEDFLGSYTLNVTWSIMLERAAICWALPTNQQLQVYDFKCSTQSISRVFWVLTVRRGGLLQHKC
jgi:hypothetical protein